VSATPLELSSTDSEVYVRERHASLQNAAFSLDQLIGLIRRQRIDQSRIFAPGTGICLDLDDAYLANELIAVRALPENQFATLTAEVHEIASGRPVATTGMKEGADGWHQAELSALPAGAYRVRVSASQDGVQPVTDVFVVLDAGTDIGD
jgi:hypothetical protein